MAAAFKPLASSLLMISLSKVNMPQAVWSAQRECGNPLTVHLNILLDYPTRIMTDERHHQGRRKEKVLIPKAPTGLELPSDYAALLLSVKERVGRERQRAIHWSLGSPLPSA